MEYFSNAKRRFPPNSNFITNNSGEGEREVSYMLFKRASWKSKDKRRCIRRMPTKGRLLYLNNREECLKQKE